MTGQSVRPTQFILTYGVGSILEAQGGPRIILDFDRWGRVFMSGKKPSVEDFEIADISASKLLNNGRIFQIPTNLELEIPDAKPVFSTGLFPRWALCERHDCLFQMSKNDGTRCPDCNGEGKTGSARRQAIRFVRACPEGHLDDVDWHGMIHNSTTGTCNCTIYHWRAHGSSLRTVYIQCTDCQGEVSLSDVYNKTNICTGRFQEKPNISKVPCTAKAAVALRGSSSLRIPDIITTITIPRRSTKLHRIFERSELKSILFGRQWTKKELIDWLSTISLRAPHLIEPQIIDVVKEFEESFIKQVIDDLLQAEKQQATTLEEIKLEELRALKSAAIDGYPPDPSEQNPQFQINKHNVRNDVKWGSLKLRITPIENLRIVMVQRGYRRLGTNTSNRLVDTFYYDGYNKWYPGIEQYGEGIFIDAGSSKLNIINQEWMENYHNHREPLYHPVFVWWHTLSHRLISALSIDSGYSSASIRERVYIDIDPVSGNASGGIILYATQPGGDGSLGGLIALVPQFERVIESATRNLHSCSNDPLCSEVKVSGGKSNGAACYACLLISETSCEHRNMLLDRNLLRNTS